MRAIFSHTSSPSAWMPSSLVTRMRTFCYFSLRREWRIVSGEWGTDVTLTIRLSLFAIRNRFHAAHIALQSIRHRNRAVGLLIGLHHRNQRAADRDAGAVERVHMAHGAAFLGAIARIHAPRLEFAADRAGRNLAVHVLPGQPYLDVVGLL